MTRTGDGPRRRRQLRVGAARGKGLEFIVGRRGSGSGLGPAVGGDRPVKGVPPPPASGGLLVLLVRPRGQLDRDSTLT